MLDGDTIVAIATAPGRGGVGIIRISGANAQSIGEHISGIKTTPRHAHFTEFKNGEGITLDSGIALFFPGPHSFTGEDVIELPGPRRPSYS